MKEIARKENSKLGWKASEFKVQKIQLDQAVARSISVVEVWILWFKTSRFLGAGSDSLEFKPLITISFHLVAIGVTYTVK